MSVRLSFGALPKSGCPRLPGTRLRWGALVLTLVLGSCASERVWPAAGSMSGKPALQRASRGEPAQRVPNDPVVAWLDAHLIPVGSDAGLAALAPMLRGRSVIGVGEATHGTREFFQVKARLFRHLVKHGGFRVLAMEAPAATGKAIDNYLQTGNGDPAHLVQGTYFFLDAVEIVDLLRWMRTYNASGTERVHFVGVDLTPEQQVQSEKSCGGRQGCLVVMRDGFMAHNALQAGPGTLLWAHNGHVGHFSQADGWKPMGQHLREALGSRYYAIALEFNQGSFIAPAGGELPVLHTHTVKHLSGRQLAEYVLGPAPPQALAHRFAQARSSFYFVDLSQANAAARAFFEGNRALQTYGANPPKLKRQYESYDPLDQV